MKNPMIIEKQALGAYSLPVDRWMNVHLQRGGAIKCLIERLGSTEHIL